MRVSFSLKFAGRLVIPRTTILTQAPLSMARLVHTVVMPRAVHLGSYLRQSDAGHPVFIAIIEGRSRRRYNANHSDLPSPARTSSRDHSVCRRGCFKRFYRMVTGF